MVEFSSDPMAVSSARIAAFGDYWDDKRGERAMPARRDLDPAEIPRLLAHLILVDIERAPFRVRYRLVGTEIVRISKCDFTGSYLDELAFNETVSTTFFQEGYRRVVEERRPLYACVPWHFAGSLSLTYDCAVFPLSDDGERVDKCVALEDYADLGMIDLDRLPATERVEPEG